MSRKVRWLTISFLAVFTVGVLVGERAGQRTAARIEAAKTCAMCEQSLADGELCHVACAVKAVEAEAALMQGPDLRERALEDDRERLYVAMPQPTPDGGP